ncbi:hypothetical protein BGZ76_005386 [Entomortierella beljakovae]|nr:hypothetical protein BGZ76_005386 [Entomortierella beljakovae]
MPSHRPDHKNEFGLYTLTFATVSGRLAILSPEVLLHCRTETPEDLQLGKIYQGVQDENPSMVQDYYIQDGCLRLVSSDCHCIPDNKELKQQLLQEVHDCPASGQFGLEKMYARLQPQVY